jgi:hypothetical protein
VKVTVRFSTLLLAFAIVLFPFPYDWLPELASAVGFDGRTVGGVLMYIEGPLVLLSLLSAASLLVYSLIRKRPSTQFACEAVAALCLALLLPTY